MDVEDWVYRLQEDLAVPVLGAAETGERAWGTADETVQHKINVVRLESPVERSLISGRYTTRKANARNRKHQRNPVGQWAKTVDLPDTISIESFDLPSFCSEAKNNPRVYHFLQSPIRYCENDEHIEALNAVARDALPVRNLVPRYQSWAQNQFERDETVGHRLGSAAALARAEYIARHECLPPMYVDMFATEAVEEIEAVVGYGRFREMLRRLRAHGRSHTVDDMDMTKLQQALDDPLTSKHNLPRRTIDDEALDEVINSAYEEYYDISATGL